MAAATTAANGSAAPATATTNGDTAPLPPPLVRAFLREDWAGIDPILPRALAELRAVGAGECWHKKSSFYAHLLETYKLLTLWGQDATLRNCGLLHSAYSNSYVNLAIFKADTDRARVAALIGADAEALAYRFCSIQRHDLIYTELLDKIPDGAPLEVPPGGVDAPNIRTGGRDRVGVYELGQFLVFTIADFSEQLFGWQDQMFGNAGDGRLRYAGRRPGCLWPGDMRPGLYLHALSKMAALLVSCNRRLAEAGDARRLPLPPLFDGCTKVLGRAEERRARDAYWTVVTECCEPCAGGDGVDSDAAAAIARRADALLAIAIDDNPYVAEPRVLRAQLRLQAGDNAGALADARQGLKLLCEWGTCWDKRMAWNAWVAWARVLLGRAERGEGWPKDNAFQVLNFGMVE